MQSSSMASSMNCFRAFFVFLLVISSAHADGIFNLKKYGAVSGKGDSTKALQDAWTDACTATGQPQLVIPYGDYTVGPVQFKGQCNGSVTIQLDGNLLADTNLNRYTRHWLEFQYIDGLTIKGKGKLDGQGTTAWPQNACTKKWNCKLLPMTMSFSFVTNAKIHGISSVNSKFFHMNIFSSNNFDIRWVTIKAPDESPNTDGIHMGMSSNINIADSIIGTGDDCVSIGSGTTNVTVSGVTCGPGHGISVGSLGKDNDKGDVAGLTVRNCKIIGTMNGIRIKTWKSKPGVGSAVSTRVSDFTFEDIVMDKVYNPIIIDQAYCPYSACPESEPSRVKISGIKFKNIRGTSKSDEVIKLVCSKRYPCEGVELQNINLEYVGDNKQLKERAVCENVKVTSSNVKPVSCS